MSLWWESSILQDWNQQDNRYIGVIRNFLKRSATAEELILGKSWPGIKWPAKMNLVENYISALC